MMDWPLDRYLTTPLEDEFDNFCYAVIDAIPDDFYNLHEDWIYSEECDKLLIECFIKGMSDTDTAKYIQNYKTMKLENYVTPFSEAEVPAVKHTIFDTDRTAGKHARCVELLDAIHDLQRRKSHAIENIKGFIGTFPESRAKCVNRIDTLNRCISRMEAAYYREVEKLIKQ